MELQSLRSVGLTAFRATETMPHERQNCVYTREYSATHMTHITCLDLITTQLILIKFPIKIGKQRVLSKALSNASTTLTQIR